MRPTHFRHSITQPYKASRAHSKAKSSVQNAKKWRTKEVRRHLSFVSAEIVFVLGQQWLYGIRNHGAPGMGGPRVMGGATDSGLKVPLDAICCRLFISPFCVRSISSGWSGCA